MNLRQYSDIYLLYGLLYKFSVKQSEINEKIALQITNLAKQNKCGSPGMCIVYSLKNFKVMWYNKFNKT